MGGLKRLRFYDEKAPADQAQAAGNGRHHRHDQAARGASGGGCDRTASRRALQSRRGYGHRRARYEGPHVACDRSGARGVRFWMARVLFRRLSDEQATQERRADAGSHDAASVRPKALRSWLTKSLNSTAALGRLQQTMDRLRRLRQGLQRQVRIAWPGVFVHCARGQCSPMRRQGSLMLWVGLLGWGCGRWNPVKIACTKRRSAIGLPNSPTPKVPAPCWPWPRFNGESWRKWRPNDKSPIGHLCRKRYVRTSARRPAKVVERWLAQICPC